MLLAEYTARLMGIISSKPAEIELEQEGMRVRFHYIAPVLVFQHHGQFS